MPCPAHQAKPSHLKRCEGFIFRAFDDAGCRDLRHKRNVPRRQDIQGARGTRGAKDIQCAQGTRSNELLERAVVFDHFIEVIISLDSDLGHRLGLILDIRIEVNIENVIVIGFIIGVIGELIVI